MTFKINSAVRLIVDIPSEGLARGAVGVVVAEFNEPMQAYEIEFTNDEGKTIAQLALLPEQIAMLT